jgi:hypothetical protein
MYFINSKFAANGLDIIAIQGIKVFSYIKLISQDLTVQDAKKKIN